MDIHKMEIVRICEYFQCRELNWPINRYANKPKFVLLRHILGNIQWNLPNPVFARIRKYCRIRKFKMYRQVPMYNIFPDMCPNQVKFLSIETPINRIKRHYMHTFAFHVWNRVSIRDNRWRRWDFTILLIL